YDLLYRAQVCSPAQTGVLFAEHLCLVRLAENCYVCPQCRRLHLHRAGGLCIECLEPFRDVDRFPMSKMPVPDDYYRFLASRSRFAADAAMTTSIFRTLIVLLPNCRPRRTLT